MNLEEAGRAVGWIGGFAYLLDVAIDRFVMPFVRAYRTRRFLRDYPPEPPPNPYDRMSPSSAKKVAEANGEDWRTGKRLGPHRCKAVCGQCGKTVELVTFGGPEGPCVPYPERSAP